MIIRADEDSLGRMLGVPNAQIPAAVLAEYELRLRMFHCDGNSGLLGTIGIIDMLRSMKLGVRERDKPPTQVDWSGVPMDGTVRVEARVPGKDGKGTIRALGVYVGQVGVGSLAVRLDGSEYVHEVRRDAVRIAREEPIEPESPEDAPACQADNSEPEPPADNPLPDEAKGDNKPVPEKAKASAAQIASVASLVEQSTAE